MTTEFNEKTERLLGKIDRVFNIEVRARELKLQMDALEYEWTRLYVSVVDSDEWKEHCKSTGVPVKYSFPDCEW